MFFYLFTLNQRQKKIVGATSIRDQADGKAIKTATLVARNKTVLVLDSNYYGDWNPVLLIDSNGRREELNCFRQYDNTEASDSCSLVWNNHLYIYGGVNYNRQISKLNQYRPEH